jgi:hypothetical protein
METTFVGGNAGPCSKDGRLLFARMEDIEK